MEVGKEREILWRCDESDGDDVKHRVIRYVNIIYRGREGRSVKGREGG